MIEFVKSCPTALSEAIQVDPVRENCPPVYIALEADDKIAGDRKICSELCGCLICF